MVQVRQKKETPGMNDNTAERILLAHGGGGKLSADLISNFILPRVEGEKHEKLNDSASLDIASGAICFTTDSYVVKPLFFAGGNIGKLAVCGTMNDLGVAGSRPLAMSLALIIETGFEMSKLEIILDSIGQTATENGIKIVTGDTKTVEQGSCDGIFINTAGIGIKIANPGFDKISAGDKIIISGTIGDHGMTVISQREGIKFESELKSDCACVSGLTCQLYENVDGIKFMRDPTRGGVAATLNEIADNTGLSILLDEERIPVNATVRAAADMLGFDVLNIANEGKFVAVVSAENAENCLEICRKHSLGKEAAIIGEVQSGEEGAVVEMVTAIGGRRIVQMPYGRELPRIC